MKKSKVIILGNQKGGVGKSTITSLLANYIHLKTDYSVCVCDCDDKQKTLSKLRARDIEAGHEEKNLYDLIRVDSISFKDIYDDLYGEYDFIFVDLPGNLMQRGVVLSYALADFMFIPTGISFQDIDSLILFLGIYEDEIKPVRVESGFEETKIYGFLNNVNPRLTEVVEFINEKENMPIPILNKLIPQNDVAFKRNASTSDLYEKAGDAKAYDQFCKEVLSIITKN